VSESESSELIVPHFLGRRRQLTLTAVFLLSLLTARMLAKIDGAGMLDSFVLLNQADAGIAQDYSAYRAAHRDRLDRCMDEFVVPKTPESAANPR
jgi:hypothetical protein